MPPDSKTPTSDPKNMSAKSDPKPKPRKKYANNEYKEEYCELVVKVFSGGGTLSDFCVAVGNPRRTVYGWIKRELDFRDAYAFARECGKAYYDQYIKDHLPIDNSEGAINYDVKTYMKLHSRRFMDLNRETPPPNIISEDNPDLYEASRKLAEATVDESLTIDQSKALGNIIKTLLEVKEKESLAQKLDEVEKILKSGQQTNNVPVNSPEPEFINDNKAE